MFNVVVVVDDDVVLLMVLLLMLLLTMLLLLSFQRDVDEVDEPMTPLAPSGRVAKMQLHHIPNLAEKNKSHSFATLTKQNSATRRLSKFANQLTMKQWGSAKLRRGSFEAPT